MSRETLMQTNNNTKLGRFVDKFVKRVATTPTGVCPVGLQLSLLQASHAQTCGKCVPCRDGLGQLEELINDVLDGTATEETLEQIEKLATVIKESADCAVGYDAAEMVLEGLKEFRDEYEYHVTYGRCMDEIGQSVPCKTLCPAHVQIPEYVALVGEGRYADAINMIRQDNPFPTACALICEHPCEAKCRRNIIDSPINIRGIKKFAVDQITADNVKVPARLADTGKNVAVIGGGPSGLTAAYFLALMGHKVTVFEEKKQLGGMLRYGIPAYRFPRERLDEDIRAILSVGNIEVKLESNIGNKEEIEKIRKAYDAMYVAIGAHAEKSLRIDGVGSKNVYSAVDILREIGYGRYPDFSGKKVVVIGGGNVAMDCARTAVRSKADTVSIVYRRRQDDMTALAAEVESAIAEGIELLTLKAPLEIVADANGQCTGLKVQKQMSGTYDKAGRPSPVNADVAPEIIPCDIVLIAVGQDIVSQPFEDFGMPAKRHVFETGADLAVAGMDGVYVGGDCQTAPATVIKAIAAGKVAAANIDEYLGFAHELASDIKVPAAKQNNTTPTGRINITERPASERKHDFEGVEEPMSLAEAKQECGRCLRCDHFGCGTLEGGRA